MPCLPSFPYKGGWLGGDGGTSVVLPDGRIFWLFADSFVGHASQSRRTYAKGMVRNCIALSSCDAQNGWSIQYFWRNKQKGKRRTFFDPGKGEFWYWPMDAFVYKDSVYVALLKSKPKPEEKIFSFENTGVDLARLSNLSKPPEDWEVKYWELADGKKAYPGVTIVLQGDYAYLFAMFEGIAPDRRSMILTRLPLDGLSNPSTRLEYLGKDKSWKLGLKPEDALQVIEKGQSDMSVRYHPRVQRWVAVSLEPRFLSNKIVVAMAPELAGPWSAWQTVYEIPEMIPTASGWDKDTWCYNVKEHIEFASREDLVVTYVCNSFDFGKMVRNMNIYRPQTVTLRLPQQIR